MWVLSIPRGLSGYSVEKGGARFTVMEYRIIWESRIDASEDFLEFAFFASSCWLCWLVFALALVRLLLDYTVTGQTSLGAQLVRI